MTKDKKQDSNKNKDSQAEELEKKLDETTLDLKRTRADFENYRKRVELEKELLKNTANATTILRLLPVIDNIDRALSHLPDHLKDDQWAKSVINLSKNLNSALEGLKLTRIEATPGTPFNPDFHEAIQMEDGEGDHEVIADELQAGYMMNDVVIRHSLVKVTKVKELTKKEKK